MKGASGEEDGGAPQETRGGRTIIHSLEDCEKRQNVKRAIQRAEGRGAAEKGDVVQLTRARYCALTKPALLVQPPERNRC